MNASTQTPHCEKGQSPSLITGITNLTMHKAIQILTLLCLSFASFTYALEDEAAAEQVPVDPATLVNRLDDDICAQMAFEKKCEDAPDMMREFCHKACYDLIKSQSYYQRIEFDEDTSEEFYELQAKNMTGYTHKFSEFDGYITSIITIGISCQEGEEEILASKLEEFRKTMPYTLKLLAFPFFLDPSMTKCPGKKDYPILVSKKRKNLHIMDFAKINTAIRPADYVEDEDEEDCGDLFDENSVHPVFRFLKKHMKKDRLKDDRTTFFFINPVASRMDVLEGAPLSYLKKHIKEHLITWEDEL